MFAFQICMAGIVATGGALVLLTSYRNAIVYIVIACMFLSYLYFFCVRKKNLTLNYAEKSLVCFITIGILYVLLSYLGLNQGNNDLDLYYDKSFIARQAVYLAVLPTIILFQDSFYTKGKEYLINHYGEFLFWVLYAYELFYLGKEMSIATNLLLGWLALRIKSSQTWRNWLRYAVVLFTPMTFDGTSTMLILRLLFALILIIPKGWNRTTLKWVAFGVMAVLILVSYLVPVLISDTTFIKDDNTRWRLNYWIDEMQNLANTNYLGVGYGTSYPSIAFSKTTFFYETDMYTAVERTFVLACHNSLVSVAMRTGILGITALLLFVFLMTWEMLRYKILPSKAAFFALFGAVVNIAFNVGLESPNFLFCFVFCLGECNQEVSRIRKESRVLVMLDESI